MLSMLRLSAITNIPVAILMGREPAGLNATGESDFNIFYDKAMMQQQNDVAPKIVQLIDPLCAIRKKKPSAIRILFEPLIQMTDAERAEVYLKVAQADNTYINNGVLTDDEVSESRFSKDGFQLDTHLDRDARERLKKAEAGIAKLEGVTVGGDPMEALNGAQMKSIVDIVALIDAPEGGITPNQAKGIIRVSIPGLTEKQLNEIVKK
jgi:hypothetical protein